jgi:hypothetical protein
MVRVLFLVAVVVGAMPAGADDGTQQEILRVRCSWRPPLTGSTPVRYQLQIQDVEAESALDTVYTVPHQGGYEHLEQEFFFEDGDFWIRYRARVRAEDARGRLGPWSPWNEPKRFYGDDP